jgi:hypothetical protein
MLSRELIDVLSNNYMKPKYAFREKIAEALNVNGTRK